MKIKLIKATHKRDEKLYNAFVKGTIPEAFFTDEVVELEEAPPFPIYIAKGNDEEKKAAFLQAFAVIANNYVQLDRDIHFNDVFWYSLFLTHHRQYIIETYPQVLEAHSNFMNVVMKHFDWENYVYKCILAVEYIEDATCLYLPKARYYELIPENLDLYNYIIKSPLFRNGDFLIKLLTVIDKLQLSALLKSKIKDRPDLGKDERYGRRVVFELNKAYPVLMSPLLTVEELEREVIKALSLYYDLSQLPLNQS